MEFIDEKTTFCDECGEFTECVKVSDPPVILELLERHEQQLAEGEASLEGDPEAEGYIGAFGLRARRCTVCNTEFLTSEVPLELITGVLISNKWRSELYRSAMKARTARDLAVATETTNSRPINPPKLFQPSPALAALVGMEPIGRNQVTAKILDYIRANDLEDTENTRMINADEKLQAFVGKAQVSLFELTMLISKNLT